MKDKALVKKTGDILNVEGLYTIMNLTITLPFEISEISKNMEVYIKSDNWYFGSAAPDSSDNPKPGDYFTLSDGKKYHNDELVVGLDNIREYQIKKII